MKPQVLRALGAETVIAINDKPFAALAQLPSMPDTTPRRSMISSRK
jgi:hypothetical protein